MCKFGKMKSPLNSWNPQALGPARRAALDFWAGAQIQKLLLCFQNRVHIHILVTSFYKEYWNTAKYLQQDTWRAQLRLKRERNKMCLKKEGTCPDQREKGRGRLKIHLSVMWESGDFLLNLLVNPWQPFILNVGLPSCCWIQNLEIGLLFHWSVWTPLPSQCGIPRPLNPSLLNKLQGKLQGNQWLLSSVLVVSLAQIPA